MKIAIVSPLFPPDVATPAPYVKTLCSQLAINHTVTVLAYTYLPEAVENVRVVAIDKRRPLPRRLWNFTKQLYLEMRNADVVILQNGISTELPTLFMSYLVRTPFVFEVSDQKAVTQMASSKMKRMIFNQLHTRAVTVIDHTTDIRASLLRPEQFTLRPVPSAALTAYEHNWQQHLTRFQTIFAGYEK